jgi:phage gpG-like protein
VAAGRGNSSPKRGRSARRKVGRHGVDLSSRVVYADVQQHGNADIPPRPFINFTQRDRDRWAGMVAKHVMEATHGVK